MGGVAAALVRNGLIRSFHRGGPCRFLPILLLVLGKYPSSAGDLCLLIFGKEPRVKRGVPGPQVVLPILRLIHEAVA